MNGVSRQNEPSLLEKQIYKTVFCSFPHNRKHWITVWNVKKDWTFSPYSLIVCWKGNFLLENVTLFFHRLYLTQFSQISYIHKWQRTTVFFVKLLSFSNKYKHLNNEEQKEIQSLKIWDYEAEDLQ